VGELIPINNIALVVLIGIAFMNERIGPATSYPVVKTQTNIYKAVNWGKSETLQLQKT